MLAYRFLLCVTYFYNIFISNCRIFKTRICLHHQYYVCNSDILTYKISDSKDAEGNTALHLACEENRVDEAKQLVTHGANVLVKNKEEKTPLDLASPGLVRQLKEIKENIS